MANGIIELTKSGSGDIYGQIVWSSISNGTEANTSTVTASIQLKRPAGWYTQGTWSGSLTVGNTTKNISVFTKVQDSWLIIDTVTATVNHNADGSGTCYIYGVINGPSGTSMSGTSVSGSSTVTLDKITRFATIVSASNFTDEENPTITYSNPAGSAVSLLQACISLDGTNSTTSYKDLSKTGTSYTFSLTDSERNALRSATPNGNALKVYFIVQSKIGNTTQKDSASYTMSIVNADPTVSPSIVDTNSATIKVTGNSSILVANRSTAKVTINASAKKYASITNQRVEHGTQVLTGDGNLNVTNNPIIIVATDSRGNSVTQNAANTIVPYINPTCVVGNNIPDADGSFTLEVTGLFYNGKIGSTTNSLTVQYRYKPAGGSYSSWTNFASVRKNGNGYTATISRGGLDYQTVYTFQARVIDSLNSSGVLSAEKAVISRPVFDWSQYDFNFNVPVAFGAGLRANSVTLTSADDLNNIKSNGWYQWSWDDVPANAPSGNGTSYMRSMRVWANGYECYQEVIDMSDSSYQGCMMRRTIYDRTAYPWEWVNPPMTLAVEYRTIEHFNGKPVYAKAVDVGTLPNNTYKEVHIAYNIDAIVRLDGYAYWNTSTYTDKVPLSHFGVSTVLYGSASLRFSTSSNLSSYNAYAILYYTKSTD